MIIQIYEIQTPDEAARLIDIEVGRSRGDRLRVDHIGSVVQWNHAWRNETLKATIRTVQAAGRKSSLIPLFSDPDTISRCLDYYRPDIVHFCETLPLENPTVESLKAMIDLQKRIRERFPDLAIMRSIPVSNNGTTGRVPSMALARLFEPFSDWFLTDTLLVEQTDQNQPVSGYVGITGKTCDWQVAHELVENSSIPVILAGGIGPDNVREGIIQVAPAGVDSCTRTNAVDDQGNPIRFKKDLVKVKAMIEAASKAQAEPLPR